MDQTIIERFKALGSFRSNVVKTPWDKDVVDVETIHKNAFESILNELNRVKATSTSDIFVLKGEPGSGKSHLLWRIAKSAEQKRFLFVSLDLYLSEENITYSSLLAHTIESLLRKHSELKAKPIDHLVGAIIKEGLEEQEIDIKGKDGILISDIQNPKMEQLPYVYKMKFSMLSKETKNKIKFLIADNIQAKLPAPKGYLTGILSGLIDPQSEKSVLDLLRGEKVDKESLKELKLTSNFFIDEHIAFEVLKTIFNISPFPFIVSIDQVDALLNRLTEEKIQRIFSDIIALEEKSENVLFFLSAQTQTLMKLTNKFPKNVNDRLSNATTINPITLEEALEIVKKRICFAWDKLGEKQTDYFYPLKENDITKIYKAGRLRNPRAIIKSVDYLLENGAIEMQYHEDFEEVFKEYNSKVWYERELMRRETSDLLIKLLGAENIKSTNTFTILKVGRTGFGINNSKTTYFSTVKNLSERITKGIINSGVLIRDATLPISNLRKTSGLLRKYDIKVKYFDSREGKELIAIGKILRDTESKDIALDINEVYTKATERIKKIIEVKTNDKYIPCNKENITAQRKAKEKNNKKNPLKRSVDYRKVNEQNSLNNDEIDSIVARIEKLVLSRRVINLNDHLVDSKSISLVEQIASIIEKKPQFKVTRREDGVIWLFLSTDSLYQR